MEDIDSFGPSVVVAVGLEAESVEKLQRECSERKFRLIVAARQSELPLSVQCDYAIVGALLPDGDGRRLAGDFARGGANVLIVDNAGPVAVADAWGIGATESKANVEPSDWLDQLTDTDQVEAVSRAGRLMEALRLADSVESAAAFSGSTGVPVSFVRIRAEGNDLSGLEEALDQLTSIVGMTTVFHDNAGSERFALVVNGDRRRLTRLLGDLEASASTKIAVVEVSPEDDLAAVAGRSRLGLSNRGEADERPRVLIALSSGRDKASETLRSALHRMDFTPLFWDASFRFEDVRANPPVAAVIDGSLPDELPALILASALDRDPPIPALAVSDEGDVSGLKALLDNGASDFLIWPFSLGEVQAAIARTVAIGGPIHEAAAQERATRPPTVEPESETVPPGEAELHAQAAAGDELEASDEPEAEEEVPVETEPVAVSESEPSDEQQSDDESATESPRNIEPALAEAIGRRLMDGEPVAFEGVGVLSVRHETSRITHDERGRTIVEPPRRTLNFEPVEKSDDDPQTS